MTQPQLEPEIIKFGPYRVIGLSCASKNENGEFGALWGAEDGFIARMGEVMPPSAEACSGAGCHSAFGLCRCLPGVTDGSFEYIAAAPAAAEAPIPAGMIEAQIPAGTYAVFTVPSLNEVGDIWGAAMTWLGEQANWRGFCDETVCDCAHHPSFELSPPDFGENGKLFIYLPLQPRE